MFSRVQVSDRDVFGIFIDCVFNKDFAVSFLDEVHAVLVVICLVGFAVHDEEGLFGSGEGYVHSTHDETHG